MVPTRSSATSVARYDLQAGGIGSMSDHFAIRWLAIACAALCTTGLAHAGRAPQRFLPPELSACQSQNPVTANVPPNGAPVPDPARGQFSNGFFHVEEIAPDFYYATDGTFQSAFVVSKQGIIAIDAPPM